MAGVAPVYPAASPSPLAPQHVTVSSDRSAQVCQEPALTAVAGVVPVYPAPSPSPLYPQHVTVPSERSAQAWAWPALTATAGSRHNSATQVACAGGTPTVNAATTSIRGTKLERRISQPSSEGLLERSRPKRKRIRCPQ